MDTVDWSKDRYDDIVQKLRTFLRQAGFKDADISFVPCSGLVGDNLSSSTPAEHPLGSWYSGPTLAAQIGYDSLLVLFRHALPGVCSANPVWAQKYCRISPPCFLVECRKRRLNPASFVLLCFVLFAVFWVVFSFFIIYTFNLFFVMYFPAWTNVNGSVWPSCADHIKNLLTHSRRAKRRHQSPERMILSHVSCFIQGEVIEFQVWLDSLHPRSVRVSCWSPPVLQVKLLRSSGRQFYSHNLAEHGKAPCLYKGRKVWLPSCPSQLIIAHMVVPFDS